MPSSLYNAKVSQTFQTVLHFSNPLTAGDPTLYPVYDGAGTASSINAGASGAGIGITGNASIYGALSVTGAFNLNGSLNLLGGINDLSVLSSGSDVTAIVPGEFRAGTIRLEDSSKNYRLIFGNHLSAISEVWVFETNPTNNNLYIKRGISDANPPISIDRSTGVVTINSLAVNNSANTIPTGMLGEFPSLVIPSGWLVCDGAWYTVVQYPTLAQYLSSAYGGQYNGSGTLTAFKLPDYRGMFTRALDFATAGGGSATGRDPQVGRTVTATQSAYAGYNTYQISQDDGDAQGGAFRSIYRLTINGNTLDSTNGPLGPLNVDNQGSVYPSNAAVVKCIKT